MPNASRSLVRLVLLAGLCLLPLSVQAQPFPDLTADSVFGQKAPVPKMHFEVAVMPRIAQPGDEVTLAITAKPPKGYYIYSTNPSFGGATKITAEAIGLTPVGDDFRPDHEPKKEFDAGFQRELEKFYDEVTWTRTYRVTQDAKDGKASIRGKVEGQYCGNGSCVQIRPAYQFEAVVNVEPKTGGSSAIAAAPAEAAPTSKYVHEERPLRRQKADPVVWTMRLSPEHAKPGETVKLSITATLDEGWHTYSLTQKGIGATPTRIELSELNGLEPLGDSFTPDRAPKLDKTLPDTTLEEYEGGVTWTRDFQVLPTAGSEGYGVRGTVKYQVCTDSLCLNPWQVPFALGHLATAVAAIPSEAAAAPLLESVDAAAAAAGTAIQNMSLWTFLATAFVAGLLALLTPCVFPMVPITVSLFLKQAEKEHHRPVFTAFVYCAGIVLTFTILGILIAAIFGATALNTLVNNPWLNLVIAAVLVFFGLNLLGMFELRVPGWLLTYTAGKESQGGLAGVLFMSLTFTLTSFTCTFAFVGGLLVMAAKGSFYWPILGTLTFATAFALPFFFLALFPSLLKKLPKSGGWMNTIKVTMGLIEIGAALKFFSVADVAMNPAPLVFDYTFVLTSWLIISLSAALYLLGSFRLPHDTPTESISVVRLLFAMSFLGLAAFLAVGLFAPEKPGGRLWPLIVAIAPPATMEAGTGEIGPYVEHDGLKYALDVDRAIPYANAHNQPLFLDFTGVNCANCRYMENSVWTRPAIRERLRRFVGVQLYTDNVPTIQDPQLVETLLEKNLRLQESWFRDVTLPAYAVVTPDGKEVLSAFFGKENVTGQFDQFLDHGWRKWQQRQQTAQVPSPPER